MESKIIPVYTCEFCRKNLIVKHAMIHHEKFCSKNPINWPKCTDCKNLVHDEVRINYSEDEHRTIQAFKCSAKGCGVYPAKAARKKLPEKFPATFKNQIPMPSECDQYVYHDIMSEF